MRKESREMDSKWALEIMRKAPYITVSFTRADGTACKYQMKNAPHTN